MPSTSTNVSTPQTHGRIAFAAAAIAVFQCVLAWWRPSHPLIWLPTVAAIVAAAVMGFLSIGWLRRTAAVLFAAGVGSAALPNFAFLLQWKNEALVQFVVDNSPIAALACLASGCVVAALDFDQRERRLGVTAVGIAIVLAAISIIAIGRGSAPPSVAAPSHQVSSRDTTVIGSPGAITNSVIESMWVVQRQDSRRLPIDPLAVEPPTYREIAWVLDVLRKQQGWDAGHLHSELTRDPKTPQDRVTLRVRNLSGTSMRLTLIDAVSCFDEQGNLDRRDTPLEHNVLRGNEACSTAVARQIDPEGGGSGQLNLIAQEFDQFCDPSGWFVVFADFENPQGTELLRTPLGAFDLFSKAEPVLRITAQQNSGEGRLLKGVLEP
jgi:hypothetical protein